ncbi:MAG: hypothetical protein ABW166_11530 [Sedimenticola sp.]
MKYKILTVLPIVLISNIAFAEAPISMKKPSSGSCERFYKVIEGVCVHATAFNPTSTLATDIAKFKRTGVAPQRGGESEKVAGLSKDQVRCNRYKARLEQYEREGVQGLDAATGKIVKMEDEAAETALQGARDNVEVFCEGL